MQFGWFVLACVTLYGLDVQAKSLESNPLHQIATATDQFASDVFQAVVARDAQSNVVVSPASAAIALAMISNGARGRTLNQIISTLHLPDDADVRNLGFRHLIDALQTQNLDEDLGTVFELANFMWVPKGVTVRGDFARLLRDSYSSVVRDADFTRPEAVRAVVNRRISDVTRNRIPELLPAGSVTPATQLLLANALYFKGRWLTKFDARDTVPENFYLENGRAVLTPMMKLSSTMKGGYLTDLQAKAVMLPYENERFALLVIVPDNGMIQQLESGLQSRTMRSILGKLSHRDVTVSLPRFKVDYSIDLADLLKDLGLTDMFDSSADLSGISGSSSLKVSTVVHRGTIEVNEEGSEAAAATGLQIVPFFGATGPRGPLDIRADRPFVFYLLDRDTNIPLFVGRVSDPSVAATQSNSNSRTNAGIPAQSPFAAKRPSDGLGDGYYVTLALGGQNSDTNLQNFQNSGSNFELTAQGIPIYQPSFQPHSRFPVQGRFHAASHLHPVQAVYPNVDVLRRRFRAISDRMDSSTSRPVSSSTTSDEEDLTLRAQDKHWFKKPVLEEVLIPVENNKKPQHSTNTASSLWRPAAVEPVSTFGNSNSNSFGAGIAKRPFPSFASSSLPFGFPSSSTASQGAGRPSFSSSVPSSNFPSFAPRPVSGFSGFSSTVDRPSGPQGPQGAVGAIVFPDGVDSRLKSTNNSSSIPTK